MQIKIFTPGGTIDKIYFDAKSEYAVGEPIIGAILQEAQVGFEYSSETLLKKDSLELTEADRTLIHQSVEREPANRVLITHGTDTMTDTARALIGIPDKTIVLTGSLSPARFRASDAIFNIGAAVAAVQTMPPGVYIAMNGRVFAAAKVRKNREQNRFEDA